MRPERVDPERTDHELLVHVAAAGGYAAAAKDLRLPLHDLRRRVRGEARVLNTLAFLSRREVTHAG